MRQELCRCGHGRHWHYEYHDVVGGCTNADSGPCCPCEAYTPTPAPEGEAPRKPLDYAQTLVPIGGTPTPAPASGEEELAWLRIRDVRQPQSGKSRCCGTWELVEPALLIAVRERDWILEAFARLTRELAEARAELVKTQELLGISVSRTTAARAEAARMREALEKAAPLLNVAASYRGTPPDMAANLWRAEKSARRALAQGGQG